MTQRSRKRTAATVGLAGAALLAVIGSGCSNASRTLQYSSPSPDPGVVYVSEQVYGLDDWARTSDARSYARVTTVAGEAEEGPLVRITNQTVVMAAKERGGADVTIGKD